MAFGSIHLLVRMHADACVLSLGRIRLLVGHVHAPWPAGQDFSLCSGNAAKASLELKPRLVILPCKQTWMLCL